MKKQPHFNTNSKRWIISLIVMITVSLIIIFGSDAIYNHENADVGEGRLTVHSVITVGIE